MGDRDKTAETPPRADVLRLRPARKCPICGKDAARATWPFCSKRCADVDLNRWLSGGYAIPAVEADAGRGTGNDDD